MKIKKTRRISILFILLLFVCFTTINAQDYSEIQIIPKPLIVKPGNGHFSLTSETTLHFESSVLDSNNLGKRFIDELQIETGMALSISSTKPSRNSIVIGISKRLEKEAYTLDIDSKTIQIKASNSSGIYYALQTLRQLIPGDFFGNEKPTNKVCKIQAVYIKDKPEFEWRGYMLDVSRHFFDKEKIKDVLDFMAILKLNRFHWHLADDQGWRLEIKKYPKLTSVGAWRANYINHNETINNWWGQPVQEDGEKATYGGFYTQKDIREIIAYAKARYIEILPEIDVPGHSQEILAAYPNVSCDNGNYKVATGGVFKDNALCASKEETYTFLEDVLGEVMDLFPFEYIHILSLSFIKFN